MANGLLSDSVLRATMRPTFVDPAEQFRAGQTFSLAKKLQLANEQREQAQEGRLASQDQRAQAEEQRTTLIHQQK